MSGIGRESADLKWDLLPCGHGEARAPACDIRYKSTQSVYLFCYLASFLRRTPGSCRVHVPRDAVPSVLLGRSRRLSPGVAQAAKGLTLFLLLSQDCKLARIWLSTAWTHASRSSYVVASKCHVWPVRDTMINSKFSSCSETQSGRGGGEFSFRATVIPLPGLGPKRPLGSGRPGGAGGVWTAEPHLRTCQHPGPRPPGHLAQPGSDQGPGGGKGEKRCVMSASLRWVQTKQCGKRPRDLLPTADACRVKIKLTLLTSGRSCDFFVSVRVSAVDTAAKRGAGSCSLPAEGLSHGSGSDSLVLRWGA